MSNQLCHLTSRDLEKASVGYLGQGGISTGHLPIRLQWQYLFRVEVMVDQADDMRDTLIEFIEDESDEVFHSITLPKGEKYAVRVGGATLPGYAGMGVSIPGKIGSSVPGPFKVRWTRQIKGPIQDWGRTFRVMRVSLCGKYSGDRDPWPIQ